MKRLPTALTLTLALACRPPGPQVLSAAEVGVVTQPDTISGRDGGGSSLVFGSSVWTSGDTVLAVEDADGQTWHNNSYTFASLSDGGLSGSAADGITLTDPTDSVGAPRQFMLPTPFEAEFNAAHFADDCPEAPCSSRWANWPGTPAWDEDHQRALVTYGILYLGEDEKDHRGGGHSVAIWDDVDAAPRRPVIDPTSDFPDIVWKSGDWGTASAVNDGFFFVFACDQAGLARPCRLARAALDDITGAASEKDAWTYWNGEAWGAEDAATSLFDGAPIMSLGWNAHLDAWLMVYSPPFAGMIKARSAPELTGPWSREVTLYDVPALSPPYDANAHPELAEEDGRIQYITWSRHTSGWFGSEFTVLRVELE